MRKIILALALVALVAFCAYAQEVTVTEPQPGTQLRYYNFAIPTVSGTPADFNATATELNAVVGNQREALSVPTGCRRVGIWSSDVVLNWGDSTVVTGTNSAYLATDTMHFFLGTKTELDTINIVGRTGTGGVRLYYFDR